MVIIMPYVFEARIKPNSPEFSVEFGEKVVIFVKSQPENNKANIEIIKGLSKILGVEVRIIRGLKSKNKVIFVNCSKKEFMALKQI
jgi:uncharacterized protein (TIGR00251 family)